MIGLPNGDMEWRKRSSAPPRNRWPAKRVGILTISYGCTASASNLLYPVSFLFCVRFSDSCSVLYARTLARKGIEIARPYFFYSESGISWTLLTCCRRRRFYILIGTARLSGVCTSRSIPIWNARSKKWRSRKNETPNLRWSIHVRGLLDATSRPLEPAISVSVVILDKYHYITLQLLLLILPTSCVIFL